MKGVPKFKKQKKVRRKIEYTSYHYERDFRDPESTLYQSIYTSADSLEWQRIFQLSALKPEQQLQELLKEIKLRVRITQNEIFKIGELLIHAKKICQQEGKKFKEWISDNLDFSYETANNFMNVYEQCLGNRRIVMGVKSSILYKIAAPGFPEELRQYLFDNENLDEITNGQLREITRRYKEGGFQAIKGDIDELNRVELVKKQTLNTLDMIENAIRTLEVLKTEIEKRGKSRSIFRSPFENQIKTDEPEASDINSILYEKIQSAMYMLDDARNESLKKLQNLTEETYRKCGIVEADERRDKKYLEKLNKDKG